MQEQVKRFKVGVRASAGLDPEVLLVWAHEKFGPFFNRDISFRPNVEFGWGEVTINLEPVYRLPFTPRQGRRSSYIGGGLSSVFASKNFERAEAGENSIDFDDFEYDTGPNISPESSFEAGCSRSQVNCLGIPSSSFDHRL